MQGKILVSCNLAESNGRLDFHNHMYWSLSALRMQCAHIIFCGTCILARLPSIYQFLIKIFFIKSTWKYELGLIFMIVVMVFFVFIHVHCIRWSKPKSICRYLGACQEALSVIIYVDFWAYRLICRMIFRSFLKCGHVFVAHRAPSIALDWLCLRSCQGSLTCTHLQ